MKKLISVFALLSIIFSITSCGKEDKVDSESDFSRMLGKYDILETKDIVLGNEVDSVAFTTKTGEKITVDNTADFYEIFDKVGFKLYESGKKYSCTAETKLGDQSTSFINMNVYILGGTDLYEFRTKKEADDNVASIYEYASGKLVNDVLQQKDFCLYTYKNEKAFGGTERDKNGVVRYASDAYPITPQTDTELLEMLARSTRLRVTSLFADFFECYEPYETDDKTIDFNEFVTREYKLYENYIVFKQTAPFLDLQSPGGQNLDILYAQLNNTNFSITHEAYCNVETGEIELIKVYGETLWHSPEYLNIKLEINMQMYVYNINESEYNEKVDALINYVKTNVN